MAELNKFLDKHFRESRTAFSVRFGKIELYEIKSNNQPMGIAPEECRFSAIKMACNEKIDFDDESFNTSSKKDEDSSYCSGYEKDLVTADNCLRFPPGKNFPCPFKNCKKVYTSSYGLKYHMDHGHTAEKNNEKRPYVCEIDNCGKTYKNNNGLKYHIMHAHKDYANAKNEFSLNCQ